MAYSFGKVNKFNSTRSQTSIQVALDFIKVETRASGSVGIQGIQDVRKLYGANIVIVEDIVDTGRTMVKVPTYCFTIVLNNPVYSEQSQ